MYIYLIERHDTHSAMRLENGESAKPLGRKRFTRSVRKAYRAFSKETPNHNKPVAVVTSAPEKSQDWSKLEESIEKFSKDFFVR